MASPCASDAGALVFVLLVIWYAGPSVLTWIALTRGLK